MRTHGQHAASRPHTVSADPNAGQQQQGKTTAIRRCVVGRCDDADSQAGSHQLKHWSFRAALLVTDTLPFVARRRAARIRDLVPDCGLCTCLGDVFTRPPQCSRFLGPFQRHGADSQAPWEQHCRPPGVSSVRQPLRDRQCWLLAGESVTAAWAWKVFNVALGYADPCKAPDQVRA